jgi:hypothetical protein
MNCKDRWRKKSRGDRKYRKYRKSRMKKRAIDKSYNPN